MPAALTLKQAKAAYKKRQSITITDTERRRLEREIQLEERAKSHKNRDKARVAAIRKRDAEQHRLKVLETTLPPTQRKRDIFGHKSSQFHLGAFFRKASDLPRPLAKVEMDDEAEDEFDGFDLSPSALNKLDEVANDLAVGVAASGDDCGTDEALLHASQHIKMPDLVMLDEKDAASSDHYSEALDLDDFSDFLESSTQIQRQLNESFDDETELSLSLDSSYSLGLTTEDIERLDPPTKAQQERRLMPPPSMPARPPMNTHIPDITMTQLERFVDEDICLSQL